MADENQSSGIEKKDITCTVGNTPMINIDGIYAKLETTNPTGSIKDRMACYMLSKAEERGELKPGSTILEVTSGNTGIAFAMLAAAKGYNFTAIMPESMSIERRQMMIAMGAKVVLTPAKDDIEGSMKKLEELRKNNPDAWVPMQFENPDNIEAHRKGLGKEIVDVMKGKIGAFVAGTGTGGTLIGAAKAIKEANPGAKIIAVEPEESPVIKGGKPGMHGIQGIGEGFVPKIVQDNIGLIDEIVTISTRDAVEMSKNLAREHGIFVGISSGANVLAAKRISEKYPGLENIVTVLPDRGERYLSCKEMNEE